LIETPKETGNKLLNNINEKIQQIKMQNFIHKKILKLKCSDKKQSFTVLPGTAILPVENIQYVEWAEMRH